MLDRIGSRFKEDWVFKVSKNQGLILGCKQVVIG